jgi:hypothetical protein
VFDTLARVFMVRPDRRSWLAAAVWGAIALASLTAAFWVAFEPGQLADLRQVRGWLSFTLTHSADPYAYFDRELDYPPMALLVLSPLHLIPESALALWFVPASIGVAVLSGSIFVGAIADRLYIQLSTPQRVAIVAMMLSGGGVRGAIWRGQTVALAILLGALALRWSKTRPFLAATALALCSFKPHMAVGFGLAILIIDGIDTLVIAGAIVISASLLVAAAVDQSVFTIIASYAHNLSSMYEGPDRVRGLLGIRWALDDLIGHYGLASLLYAAAASVALVLIGLVARRAPDAAGRTHAIAIALLWPLLFLPSQLYTGLMALPALWLLMWPEAHLIRRESRRLAVVAVFVAFGVVDIPRVLRLLSSWLDDGYWLYKGSYYLSPLRLTLACAFIAAVSLRRAHHRETGAAR